jgi:hypothetical protein
MAHESVFLVEVLRMETADTMKDAMNGVGMFGNSHEMDVISHQTVGGSAKQKTVATFGEQRQIVAAISFIAKDIKAPGPPLSDVMRKPRHDDTCGSSHNVGGSR